MYHNQQRVNRRQALATFAGFGAAALWPRLASSQNVKTKLILLGSGGGPRPRKASSASAQVIVIDGTPYVVDCGNGVARQLVFANVPLPSLRHLFITHHHSDHNADYGTLLQLAWAAGLATRVDTWGPPPLETITRLFFEMSATDINARIADEGRVALVPLVHAHELKAGGVVMQDERVKVTAAVVKHPPMVPSFGYRFDARDRSIVISGDTAPSDNLIALAKGADVLVHTAAYMPAVDRLIARVPNATNLKRTIVAGQTSVEDAGRVAQSAGVKTLVLSHLIPPDDDSVTDEMWIAAARTTFDGAIVVGKDLMEI
jgi:ribonuclease BN (tRNA processing enzyme)